MDCRSKIFVKIHKTNELGYVEVNSSLLSMKLMPYQTEGWDVCVCLRGGGREVSHCRAYVSRLRLQQTTSVLPSPSSLPPSEG